MKIENSEILSLIQEYDGLKDGVRQAITFGEFASLVELIKIRKLLEVEEVKKKTTTK